MHSYSVQFPNKICTTGYHMGFCFLKPINTKKSDLSSPTEIKEPLELVWMVFVTVPILMKTMITAITQWVLHHPLPIHSLITPFAQAPCAYGQISPLMGKILPQGIKICCVLCFQVCKVSVAKLPYKL